MTRRIAAGLTAVGALVAIAAGFVLTRQVPSVVAERSRTPGPSEPFIIALAGDVALPPTLPDPGRDVGFSHAIAITQRANAALGNLEMAAGPDDATLRDNGWPRLSAAQLPMLSRLGLSAVVRANNHAGDEGIVGVLRTSRLLDAAGIAHAGAGTDLVEARQPITIGDPPRRVAVISIATSTAPSTRATIARGEIAGRPSVNALRYTATLMVDANSYDMLRGVLSLRDSTATSDRMNSFGTNVTRGDKTEVTFNVNPRDASEILKSIAALAAVGDAVIISLHNHEPSNASDTPADFVREFAHQAIDNGAALVAGHGPHRLRGIEIYRGRPVFYSLGNFVMPIAALAASSPDVFDAGVDLYAPALGAVAQFDAPSTESIQAAPYWESLIAEVELENSEVKAIRLHPLDLGFAANDSEKGIPRTASPERSRAILDRVSRLSAPYGTTIRNHGGIGVVTLPTPRDQ